MKSFNKCKHTGSGRWLLTVFVILSCTAILCLMAACSQKPEETSSSQQVSNSEPETSSSEEPESSSRELLPGEPEEIDPGIPVETEHITIYFPEELTDDMTLEHLEEDGYQLIAFSGTFSGKELRLFSVIFGPAGSGTGDFQLGTLNDENAGEVPVSIRMNVQNEADWSAEDFEKINALQERVNDLIIQFYDDPRFTPTGH